SSLRLCARHVVSSATCRKAPVSCCAQRASTTLSGCVCSTASRPQLSTTVSSSLCRIPPTGQTSSSPSPTGRGALVALIADEIVGSASYACAASENAPHPHATGGRAEMAVVVEDAWQGRGIGRLILARLAGEASVEGIEAFTARILGENVGALRFITH